MSITTENTFKTSLVQTLVKQGGYTQSNAEDYCKDMGMFKNEVNCQKNLIRNIIT